MKTSLTGPKYMVSDVKETAGVDPTDTGKTIDNVGDLLTQPGIEPVKGDDVACGSKQCYTVNVDLTAEELTKIAGAQASSLPVKTDGSLKVQIRVEKDTNHLAGLTAEVALAEPGQPEARHRHLEVGRAGHDRGPAGRPGPGVLTRAERGGGSDPPPARRGRAPTGRSRGAAQAAPPTMAGEPHPSSPPGRPALTTRRRRGRRDGLRRARRGARAPRRSPPGCATRRGSTTTRPARPRPPDPAAIAARRARARRGDRPGPQPRAGPRRHDDRGPAADPRRRRLGQDARPGPPDRLPRRRQGRRAVADPRGHVHEPGGRRAARADHQPRRRGRPRRPGRHVPRALRPRPAPGRRGDRDRPPVRHLRHRRPAVADEADPARGGHAADRRVPPERGPRRDQPGQERDARPDVPAENAANHRERTIARLATRYQERLRKARTRSTSTTSCSRPSGCSTRRPTSSPSTRRSGATSTSTSTRTPTAPQYLWVRALAAKHRNLCGRRRRRPVDLLAGAARTCATSSTSSATGRTRPWSSSSRTTARPS